MPLTTTPTILDLKSSFLHTQILTISQPLHASSQQDPAALPQKAIDDALAKLNSQLRKHNRLHYAPQALRHVAEQIDRLYWRAGERGAGGGVDAGGEEGWVARGADFRNDQTISLLPPTFPSSSSTPSPSPEEAARYTSLQTQLVSLNERRRTAREKVQRYEAARALLEQFGAVQDVQENLVARNGAVERELERMRMLMLRVERGVGRLEGKGGREGEEMDVDVEGDGDRKVLALLNGN